MTTATQTQTPVASTYNHFDVLDTIENITHPLLKAMVLGSMEWSIKTQCINIARDVFYRVRESAGEHENAIDNFNEFINAMAELKANEQYNTDLGFEENTGALQQLAMLTTIRQTWYDQAEMAHGSAKLPFKTKSYEELIAAEKVRNVDAEIAGNLGALAEFASKGDPDKAARAKEALIRQQQIKFASQHSTRQLIAPAVVNIITMAEYRATDDVSFWQLANETQERLITATRSAIERNLATLATWRGVTQFEYATAVLPDAFTAIDELTAVLASPKFN